MIFEKLAGLIAEHLDIEKSEITEETPFASLGFDSLDVAEIMMQLEDEFDIEISFDEVGTTVGALASCINKKLA